MYLKTFAKLYLLKDKELLSHLSVLMQFEYNVIYGSEHVNL